MNTYRDVSKNEMKSFIKQLVIILVLVLMITATLSSAFAATDSQHFEKEIDVPIGNVTSMNIFYQNIGPTPVTFAVEVNKLNTNEILYPFVSGVQATIVPAATSLQSNKRTFAVLIDATSELDAGEYTLSLVKKIDGVSTNYNVKVTVVENKPSMLQKFAEFYENHMLAIGILLASIIIVAAIYVVKKWGEK